MTSFKAGDLVRSSSMGGVYTVDKHAEHAGHMVRCTGIPSGGKMLLLTGNLTKITTLDLTADELSIYMKYQMGLE